jgi:hypothetical protein
MTMAAKNYSPFWETLLEELTGNLAIIQQGKMEISLGQAQQALQACKASMNLLQEHVIQTGFSSESEEIFFFKEIKPRFYSLLIYYHRLYNIEVSRPVGSEEDIKNYYRSQLNKVYHFFEENKFWYQYHRSGETHLDEKLFLRTREGSTLSFCIYDFNAHPLFATGIDYIFSRIIANELLADYLRKALLPMANEKQGVHFKARPLTWTDTKSALIEFAYAAKAKGVFDYGKATQKEIIDYLQDVFNLQIKNPTRDFQEILHRKGGYTLFLDSFRESYLKYIDQLESEGRK